MEEDQQSGPVRGLRFGYKLEKLRHPIWGKGKRFDVVYVLAFHLWRPNPDCIDKEWGSWPNKLHFYPHTKKNPNKK